MTCLELIDRLQRRVHEGFGDKPVFVEDAQEKFHIHSVQQDTCAGIEPTYLFIMAGEKVDD